MLEDDLRRDPRIAGVLVGEGSGEDVIDGGGDELDREAVGSHKLFVEFDGEVVGRMEGCDIFCGAARRKGGGSGLRLRIRGRDKRG